MTPIKKQGVNGHEQRCNDGVSVVALGAAIGVQRRDADGLSGGLRLDRALGRLVRAPWATGFTVAVIAIALTLPAGFALLVESASRVSDQAATAIDLSVYFKLETPLPDVQQRASQLRTRPDVSAVQVITAEQALQQLQGAVAAVGHSKGPTGPAAAPVNVAEVATKMSEVRDVMEQSNDATVAVVDKLKNSSSNPGSQYYWLLFVAMYGGMYFFGGE
jgi:cell division transport system permease protein